MGVEDDGVARGHHGEAVADNGGGGVRAGDDGADDAERRVLDQGEPVVAGPGGGDEDLRPGDLVGVQQVLPRQSSMVTELATLGIPSMVIQEFKGTFRHAHSTTWANIQLTSLMAQPWPFRHLFCMFISDYAHYSIAFPPLRIYRDGCLLWIWKSFWNTECRFCTQLFF